MYINSKFKLHTYVSVCNLYFINEYRTYQHNINRELDVRVCVRPI